MRDRIIGIRQVKASDLVEHPRNPSQHSDLQRDVVSRSMTDIGLVDALKGVELPDGRIQIFDGHLRRDIAGDELVSVLLTDLSETEVNAVIAQFDWSTTLKDFDLKALEELIESVPQDAGSTFAGMFQNQAESLKLWAELEPEPPKPEKKLSAEIDEESAGEPICKLGELWQLGKHRLLCGDATLEADVRRLMAKKQATVVFADPPYGVNIQGGNQNRTIAGDTTQTAIPFGFELAVSIATTSDARLYFCGGEGNVQLYAKLFERFCRQQPRLIIWVKENFTMKPNGYHNQYEIIFHGFKAGGGALKHWYSPRTAEYCSDVWEINRDPAKNYEHPTQKPKALAARAIANSSAEGDIIYDCFGGSGATLIAAEELGRICYMMEIDPLFCDVIIRRFERETGKKAKKLK